MHEDPFMRFTNYIAYFDNSLKADFSPIFHWNVKMIFAYVVFEYSTEAQPRNQIVLWDKIIMNGADPVVNLKEFQNKYPAADLAVNGLKGVTGEIKLYWNTVPHVGYLFDSQHGSQVVDIPREAPKPPPASGGAAGGNKA